MRELNQPFNVDLEEAESFNALVPSGGTLPHSFEVATGKFLDVVMALSPKSKELSHKQKQRMRKDLNAKLYNKCRPGFYAELSPSFHFAYAGQPDGHSTPHHWRLFCDDGLRDWLESFIHGTTLTTSNPQSTFANGHYTQEWGGLYLRSEAELKIAEALDRAGILFFANARGRVGLQDTLVSNGQLTGRVEVDFLIVKKGKSLVLEVDGSQHSEEGQAIRDYAKDRVLLRFGLPTVRFTVQDCLIQPDKVIAEALTILHNL
jgi:very-short-patch-repair endonuclease